MSRCIQKKKALIFPRKINTLCINRYSFFPLQVIMVQHTVSMIHTAFFPNLPAFKNQAFRKTGFSSVNMGQKAQNDIFHLLLPVLRFRLFCIMIRKEYSRALLYRKTLLFCTVQILHDLLHASPGRQATLFQCIFRIFLIKRCPLLIQVL